MISFELLWAHAAAARANAAATANAHRMFRIVIVSDRQLVI
jgi:hypothetical protein